MRHSSLVLTFAASIPLAFASACSDRNALSSLAPHETPDGAIRADVTRAPSSTSTDRVLVDSRAGLQSASTLSEGLAAIHATESNPRYWAFTTDVDGSGTHALRIDWPRTGRGCATITPRVSINLPTPSPTRIMVTWKHRLGRSPSGGGVGGINEFTLANRSCDPRHSFLRLYRDYGGWDDANYVDLRSMTANGTLEVLVPDLSLKLDPNDGWSFPLTQHIGEVLWFALYVEAESGRRTNDGRIRLWMNGRLLSDYQSLHIAPAAFAHLRLPMGSTAPMQPQSEYIWDLRVSAPATEPVVPGDSSGSPTVASVTVSPAVDTLQTGATAQLRAVVRGSAGDTLAAQPTWTSADTTIAPVSASGLVTARKAGSTTITAATGGHSGTALVTVTPPTPTATQVIIAPRVAMLAPGAIQQFAAQLRMSDGTTRAADVMYNATGGAIASTGLYTAGPTAGTYTVIARQSAGALADTASVTILSPPPPSGSTADPTLLPRAAQQAGLFQQYVGGSLRAGQSYLDPVTGVRVWKVTDPSTPVANGSAIHDYSSGPVQASREWSGHHTVLVGFASGGTRYLVDFTRGVGLSNYRPAPSVNADLSFSFSLNPATPQIAYYLSGNTLSRYNTATNTAAPTGFFPKSFASVTSAQLFWLQQDMNDTWFVMMTRDQSTIIAWNSQTNQTLTMTGSQLGLSIDEPHLERNGRYVFVRSGSTQWKAWDLQTGAVWSDQPQGQTHPGSPRGLWSAFDPNSSQAPYWWYDPATRTTGTFAAGGRGVAVSEQHRADQWIQSDADLGGDLHRQWMLFDDQYDGHASFSAWRSEGGQVYSAALMNGGDYDNSAVGVTAVRQASTANANIVALSLSSVTTVGALTEGTFFYDAGALRVYVWAIGGGDPTGRVDPRVAGAVHEGLALYRLDGSEVRLLAHHYSVGNPSYWQTPRSTISADGKIALFDSNMNLAGGRGDVFLVEVPVR